MTIDDSVCKADHGSCTTDVGLIELKLFRAKISTATRSRAVRFAGCAGGNLSPTFHHLQSLTAFALRSQSSQQ